MDVKISKSAFALEYFLVEKIVLEQSPSRDKPDVKISIDPSGVIYKSKRKYQLQLLVNIADKNNGFTIEITAVGLFNFKADEEELQLSNYFYINAPAIIFPYIRSYVSSITALSGINTVNLPLMNLSNLKDKLIQNTVEVEQDLPAPKKTRNKK